jgi:hypothetical protein
MVMAAIQKNITRTHFVNGSRTSSIRIPTTFTTNADDATQMQVNPQMAQNPSNSTTDATNEYADRS